MIYLLNKQDGIVGVLSNDAPLSCPYFDDLHIENIESGVNSYEFSVPAGHDMASNIEVNGSVIVPDLDGRLQIFAIKQLEEVNASDGYIKKAYCEHTAISELLTDIVRPRTFNSMSLKSAVEYILIETDWKLGDTELEGAQDVVFESHITVLEALNYILELFDAEVQFEVIVENGMIQEKLIHVKKQLGSETYKSFSYTKDLQEVHRKEDTDGLITALIAIGKGDTQGSQVSLLGLTRTDGIYRTDSDNDYVEDTEALQLFGKNGKHLFGTISTESDNQLELFEDAVRELKVRSKPRVSYECQVVLLERIEGWDGEQVRVGDKVRVLDYSFSPALLLEARVLELKRSYTDSSHDEITLGDYRPLHFSDTRLITKLQDKILQKEEQWNATSHVVEIVSSQGLIFKGSEVATTLSAVVYVGGVDITGTLNDSAFHWTRKTSNVGADITWNNNNGNNVKSITVSGNDFIGSTTFNCEVTI